MTSKCEDDLSKILRDISRCCDQFQYCRIACLTSLVSVDCSQVIVCCAKETQRCLTFRKQTTHTRNGTPDTGGAMMLPRTVWLVVGRARYAVGCWFLTKAVKRPLILGSVMSVSIPVAYESSCLVFLFIKFPTGTRRKTHAKDRRRRTTLCTRMTTVLSTELLQHCHAEYMNR